MLHGQTRYNVASRFLGELPAEALKWLTPKLGAPRFDIEPRAAAPERRPSPRQAAVLPFRIGQSVLHPKFGEGVIIEFVGQGAQTQVHINFGRQGLKRLMLDQAPLSAA
jgi:DNA helicase-2/ATP-dependent DNA helicase PcrA